MSKIYKEPTLTQIKKEVVAAGGEHRKLRMKLNGNDAYEVNERVMTKLEMIERYKLGEL